MTPPAARDAQREQPDRCETQVARDASKAEERAGDGDQHCGGRPQLRDARGARWGDDDPLDLVDGERESRPIERCARREQCLAVLARRMAGAAHCCAPTLATVAAALPPEGEQFAPWGGPAARMCASTLAASIIATSSLLSSIAELLGQPLPVTLELGQGRCERLSRRAPLDLHAPQGG